MSRQSNKGEPRPLILLYYYTICPIRLTRISQGAVQPSLISAQTDVYHGLRRNTLTTGIGVGDPESIRVIMLELACRDGN